jgi:hypothetical protein
MVSNTKRLAKCGFYDKIETIMLPHRQTSVTIVLYYGKD